MNKDQVWKGLDLALGIAGIVLTVGSFVTGRKVNEIERREEAVKALKSLK